MISKLTKNNNNEMVTCLVVVVVACVTECRSQIEFKTCLTLGCSSSGGGGDLFGELERVVAQFGVASRKADQH